ncbi:MAG: carboxypeptidase-like regulatory domain-containing protein, partial [Vulcanimicrobiaceae bacterium]
MHIPITTFALHLLLSHPAAASTFLTGTVRQAGVPVAGVVVTASGNNAVARTTTDSQGRFSFPGLAVGTYTLTAALHDFEAVARVDVSSAGASVELGLRPFRTIGTVSVARAPVVRESGADVSL